MEVKEQSNTSGDIIFNNDEYCELEDEEIHPPQEEPLLDINLPSKKDDLQSLVEEEKHNDIIYDEDNIIYDPKVRKLNEIDISNKQEIIDILMDESLITKKPIINEESIKEKNKNKYPHIRSSLTRTVTEEAEHLDKKPTYAKFGYQINSKKGNPEFIKDINTAARLLKNDIIKENKDVAQLLFNDINKSMDNKRLTGKQIGEKIKATLENKKKHLEEIEAKVHEEQKFQETFAPVINRRKKDEGRRDLNTFLKSMDEFQKKKDDKNKLNLLTKETEIRKLNIGKPQVDKNSEKLFKRKSMNEPAFKRLYDKRVNNMQKMKEAEEKKLLLEKEEEKKRKEKEYELKKNNPYKHIKSKINLHKKTQSQTDLLKEDYTNNPRHSSVGKKVRKVKSAININKYKDNSFIKTKTNLELKDIESNKILYNKFIINFEKAFNSLKNEINDSENNLQELDLYQYHKLLYNLNIVTYQPEKLENKENNILKKDKKEKNGVQIEENKLVNDSFNILKLKRKKVKLKNVKNFLICALGLQNYNLYRMFMDSHEHEIKKLFPLSKYKKEEIPELIIIKQNEELLSKISKKINNNNKYFQISKNREMFFTSEKASNIKLDFSTFGVNYRKKKQRVKEEKLIYLIQKNFTFKPDIGEKSNELYQKYKDRVHTNYNETNASNSKSNSIFQKTATNYLDRVLLLEQKKEAECQKKREEIEQKEKQECTFRPKISPYNLTKREKRDEYNLKYNTDISEDKKTNIITKKNSKKNKNIFIELYENGLEKIKSKKDKSKEQVELEEQKSEFTFQPKIENLDPKSIPKTNFNNDIYNEKEYQFLYERLKHGRLERLVDMNKNNRCGLNDELKKYVKDKKEYNYIQNEQYFNPDDPFFYNSMEIKYITNSINQFEQENNRKSGNKEKKNHQKSKKEENNLEINKANNKKNINSIKKNNNKKAFENLIIEKKNEIEESNKTGNNFEKRTKDDIPLLIIDVNIKDGFKKKIYVYEGDTPELLAENFAKENNLEIETKNKLQSLIRNHMIRLLSRIDEENQISSTTPNKKNK